MDLLSPIIPSIILGTIFYIFKNHTPYLIPIAISIIWFFYIIYGFGACPLPPPHIELTCNFDISILYGAAASSAAVGIISFVFTAVGVGIFRWIKVKNLWVRYVVSTYITLLLLQLWVVVFPWTIELLYGFFS